MDHSPPSYTQSDIGHGANLTPKRGSIIRRFSMLSKKQAQDSASSSSLAPWPESAARAKWTRWKKTKGTEQVDSEQRPSLPLLRVISPFSVSMPEQSPHRHTDIRGNGMKPSLQEDGPSSPPPTADPLSLMPGSASPPATDKDSPTRPRPKFTLSNESDADLSSDQHLSPCSSFSHPPPRPRLVRRDANVGSVGYGTQRRRWTLAMAMTDEDITDEVLVEELERVVLRMNSHWTGSLEDIPAGFGIWDAEIGRELWESSLESYFGRDGDTSDAGHSTEANPWPDRLIVNESPTSESGLPTGAKIPFTPSLPSFPLQHRLSTPAPASTATWQTARRALLTCRELVRTERHYLHSLQSLLASETKTPPPLLMLHYAGELVKISEGLLGRMEENPSAWGVAAAFLGKEEGVETAFVSWCGVVGTWFVDDDKADADRGRGSSRSASRKSSPVRRKLSKPSIADDKDKKAEADEDATLMSPLMRTVSTWRKSMPSISSMNESVGGSSGSQLSSSYFLSKRKEKERERNVSASSLTPPTTQGSSKRKPAVRDLAILPTQRVMRYVLLYRDLLAHTPSTSPSRALVERAVEAACRVAQKCDRAQGNAVDTSNKVAGDSSSSSSIAPGARPSSRRKITLSMTPMTSRSRADQNAEL
ncbi:hypothetical protein BDQ17DRAFT_1341444 [Cyathus striatus]|nr:hypothetical protein BDQ17DRAFT_1341444 [Cyathus striatus]